MLLLVSFICVAVLGLFGMNHESGHHGACLAATAEGALCPKESEPMDSVLFHFDAFRSFSLVAFSGGVTGALLLLFASLLSIVIGVVFFNSAFFRPPQIAFHLYRLREFSSFWEWKLIRWLSLHENSPAFLLARI